MKNLFLLLSLALISTSTFAQTKKDIIQKHWVGVSEQDAAFTKSGKAYLNQTLDIKISFYGNSVTGTSTTKMTLDGVIYTCNANVTGTFDNDKATVTLNYDEFTHRDALPGDLRWCKSWGTLKLYENKDKEGHYILRGNSTNDCGGSSVLEYEDN